MHWNTQTCFQTFHFKFHLIVSQLVEHFYSQSQFVPFGPTQILKSVVWHGTAVTRCMNTWDNSKTSKSVVTEIQIFPTPTIIMTATITEIITLEAGRTTETMTQVETEVTMMGTEEMTMTRTRAWQWQGQGQGPGARGPGSGWGCRWPLTVGRSPPDTTPDHHHTTTTTTSTRPIPL